MSAMVDINIVSDNTDFDILSSSSSSYQNNGSITTDYFDTINENDLITFDEDNDHHHFKQKSPSDLYFIDTPPETPVNYNNSNMTNNNHNVWDHFNIVNNYDINSRYSSTSDSDNNSNNSTTTIPLAIGNCCLLTNEIEPATTLIVNNQTMLNQIKSNNIQQPKTILPNNKSINNHNSSKLKQQKEHLHKQKLEARKLRNREAALNSRLKKKKYLDNLEAKIKQLGKENTDLMFENAMLKQKISDLEQEINRYRSSDLNNNFDECNAMNNRNKKAKISFFAVAFMFLIQISPYLVTITPKTSLPDDHNNHIIKNNSMSLFKSFNQPTEQHHLSRTLLWKSNVNDDDGSTADYFSKLSSKNSNSNNNFNDSYVNNNCGDYYNRTELIRLENELREWLTQFKLEENESRRQRLNHHSSLLKTKSKKKLLYDLKHIPIPRLKLWMQKQRFFNDDVDDNNDEQIQSDSYDDNLENLMSTIHRRDDTFYYLSYPSKGHLIVPPMSNRTDIRPRFSFLIPTAFNFSQQNNNSSKSNNSRQNQTDELTALTLPNHHHYLQMLQIDCQVINTKVTLINTNRRQQQQQNHHFNQNQRRRRRQQQIRKSSINNAK